MDKQKEVSTDGPAATLGQAVERAAGAYEDIDRRLAAAGGIEPVVDLYERIRREIDQLDYAALDRVAAEIRRAVERLLEMDTRVRKLNNLKLMMDREREHDGPEK